MLLGQVWNLNLPCHFLVIPVDVTLPLENQLPLVKENKFSFSVVCSGFAFDFFNFLNNNISNLGDVYDMVDKKFLEDKCVKTLT